MSIRQALAGATVYEAVAEDLSHLGGPMGTEYTTRKSLGLFEHWKDAKAACEKHYKGPLEFKRNRTEDLGWVMYHIGTKKVG